MGRRRGLRVLQREDIEQEDQEGLFADDGEYKPIRRTPY